MMENALRHAEEAVFGNVINLNGGNRIKKIIHTTLEGSGHDIGWLQRMPGVAAVEDMTNRFTQIVGVIRKDIHALPRSLEYLLVPGLFSDCAPLYFANTKEYLTRLGLTCYIAKIDSEAAIESNALALKNYIEQLYRGSRKRIIILGHSKGGVDSAAAISMYWNELRDKVSGLVLVQSPYAGCPIASDMLREGRFLDNQIRDALELLIRKVFKGDIRSLEGLTYNQRREFIKRHPLPLDIPTVCFHTKASIGHGVFSTMSKVGFVEIPRLHSWMPHRGILEEEVVTSGKVPIYIPAPAAMAACASYVHFRYNEESDGLVTRKDAEVPGSAIVRPTLKLDHAWMVYQPSRKEENEPDSAQITEALLTLLLEIRGKKYTKTSDLVGG